MAGSRPGILVLGASGLIGSAVVEGLLRRGFRVTAAARRFTPAQRAAFGEGATTCRLAEVEPAFLAELIGRAGAGIVVNCLGVLQDGPGGGTRDVHAGFVARLLMALAAQPRPALLVHLSVPGRPAEDPTPFSRTKREGERLISDAATPFVILRPGFVLAPAAYGGSTLVRALAASPFALPHAVAGRPFAATAIDDVTATIATLAERWRAGERDWQATWDVMEREPGTVGDVVAAIRARLGGPAPRATMPPWLLDLGARAGDLAARLGWSPPVRTTALAEMRRGVDGDPGPWIAALGIEPHALAEAVAAVPAGVQERWFARLFLVKPLVIGGLAAFWVASGLVALTVALEAASGILEAHGFAPGLARAATVATSLLDVAIGAAIACRRTCRAGLLAGLGLSLAYLLGATVLAPELWLDPLGPLVKVAPLLLLTLVAVAILDER